MADTSRHECVEKSFRVRVIKDVCFDIGAIGFSSVSEPVGTRELLMDVYQPAEVKGGTKLPALILAFGGAFHSGSKDDDTVEDGETRNTPIAEYCRTFASRGFVCFSVGYRLTGDDPDPGPHRWLTAPDEIAPSRTNQVRSLLGLPPATNRVLADGMEAAFNDVAAAFTHVLGNASKYEIDTARIAIGGFSSGGSSALYAVFACGVPAAAIITLSGRMEAADIQHYIKGPHPTSILQFVGEHDVEHVRILTQELANHCARVGIRHSLQHVPGVGHFYSQDAKVVGTDGAISTVDRAMLDFLEAPLSEQS